MGRGTVPPDSPEFLNRSRRDALKQSDCVILAGTLLDFRMAFGKTIPADAKIIQLDMDATLIGQNRSSDVGLVGNLACSFELLLEEMKNQGVRLDFSAWRDELRKIENAAETKVRGGAQQRRGADRPAAHVPRGARLAGHARRPDRDRRRRRHRGDRGEDPAGEARGRLDGPGPARHARRRRALRARGAAREPGQARGHRLRRRLVRPERLRVRHRRALRPADHRRASATTRPGAR